MWTLILLLFSICIGHYGGASNRSDLLLLRIARVSLYGFLALFLSNTKTFARRGRCSGTQITQMGSGMTIDLFAEKLKVSTLPLVSPVAT